MTGAFHRGALPGLATGTPPHSAGACPRPALHSTIPSVPRARVNQGAGAAGVFTPCAFVHGLGTDGIEAWENPCRMCMEGDFWRRPTRIMTRGSHLEQSWQGCLPGAPASLAGGAFASCPRCAPPCFPCLGWEGAKQLSKLQRAEELRDLTTSPRHRHASLLLSRKLRCSCTDQATPRSYEAQRTLYASARTHIGNLGLPLLHRH